MRVPCGSGFFLVPQLAWQLHQSSCRARESAAGVIPEYSTRMKWNCTISVWPGALILHTFELAKRRRASATSRYRTFAIELPKILSLLSKSLPRNFFQLQFPLHGLRHRTDLPQFGSSYNSRNVNVAAVVDMKNLIAYLMPVRSFAPNRMYYISPTEQQNATNTTRKTRR